ncbi:MAG: c-type cytochrome, partial [Isosphaeraceae bacterium]
DMIKHDHYSTGIAGIAIDTGSQFPAEYRGRAWIGNVVTNRINHDRFVRTGGTFDAVELPDFLVSNDPWFRPVDLKFGPDGALYVADFYNRIIGHYEVPLQHPGRDRERGRIWRIVYKGDKAPAADPKVATTDWTKATPDELVKALSHPNMVIRVKATNQLAARGGDAVVPALSAIIAKPLGEEDAKRHAMWVLHRMGKLSPTQLASLAQDPDATIRTHAQRILADKPHSYDGWQSLAYNGLKDTDGMVRRSAAEALGQGPRAEQVGPLVASLAECPEGDTHKRHVLRMAIRDHLSESAILEAVAKKSWSADQQATLADCAMGATTAHAAGFVAGYMTASGNSPRRDEMAGFVARYGNDKDMAALIGWGEKSLNASDQIALARSLAQGRQAGGKPPLAEQKAWTSTLVRNLIGQNTPQAGGQLSAAAELAAMMGLNDLAEPIIVVGRDACRADAVRVVALESATKLDRTKATAALIELMADAAQKATMRDQAATILGRLGQAESDKLLVNQIATAPARLQQAIAVALVQRPAGAETLLAAVEAGKASARLLKIRPVENKLKQTNLRDRDRRMSAALKGIPDVDERIMTAIAERKSFINSHRGDATAGQAIFTKNCATCHQIGTQGARIGPQLDGVGVRGVDRLLEDILDPNRNVDQAFRSTTVATKEGQVLTGLLLRDEGAVLVLADSQGRDVRVPKGEVAEQTVNPLSPMPANWADAMTPEELSNLLSFLLEQKKVKAILPDLK